MSEIIDLIAGEMQKQAAQVLKQREGLPPKLVNVFGFKRNQDDANQEGGENIITSQQGGENNNDNSNSIEVIQESAPATGQTRSSASTGMGSGPVIDNRNYGFKSAAVDVDGASYANAMPEEPPDWVAPEYQTWDERAAGTYSKVKNKATESLASEENPEPSVWKRINPYSVTARMARHGFGAVPTTAYNSLLYALSGGLLYGLYGRLTGGDALRNALIGAGVGGLLGIPVGHQIWQYEKTASDPLAELIAKVNNDYTMSPNDKANLILKLRGMPHSTLSAILSSVAPMMGAGVGAAIARFILGAGVMGTIASGVLGYGIGNLISNAQGNTPLMQQLVQRDAFGNLIG